jgi:hypothetical protein
VAVNTEAVPRILAHRTQSGGGLNLDAVLADVRGLGGDDPSVVLEQALTDAQREASLRPWRLYLLRALQELAAQDVLGPRLLPRLWVHTIELVDVFGDEELERTIAALSHTRRGLQFLAKEILPELYLLYRDRDPRSADWSQWVMHAAGLLAERKSTQPQVADLLEKLIKADAPAVATTETQRRAANTLLEFHRKH